ncbi:MAG: ester cyclase [Pseudonocardiaceae bacterium]
MTSNKETSNKDVLRSILTEVFERGDLDALDRYVTPDFVNHRTPPGIPPSVDGVKSIAGFERAAFPDLRFTVEHEVEEGDLVIQVATAEATHLGRIFGVEATGRPVRWQQVHIARMRGGRMAEHWGISDVAALWTQIGRATAIGPPAADAGH